MSSFILETWQRIPPTSNHRVGVELRPACPSDYDVCTDYGVNVRKMSVSAPAFASYSPWQWLCSQRKAQRKALFSAPGHLALIYDTPPLNSGLQRILVPRIRAGTKLGAVKILNMALYLRLGFEVRRCSACWAQITPGKCLNLVRCHIGGRIGSEITTCVGVQSYLPCDEDSGASSGHLTGFLLNRLSYFTATSPAFASSSIRTISDLSRFPY